MARSTPAPRLPSSARFSASLGNLAKGALKFATPALNFIPGVGPIAAMAAKPLLSMIPDFDKKAPAPAASSSSSALSRPSSTPVIVRAPTNYQAPPVTAQPSYRPPGAAATQNPMGRLRPGGIDLLRTLIFRVREARMFRVEVKPAWNLFPGDPGSEFWVPVFALYPHECVFETRIEARSLLLACLTQIRLADFGYIQDRELRIREFCDG